MSCGVYAITNVVTGKAYVGSSVNIESRLSKHLRELKKGTHYNAKLQRAFDKYGVDNFSTEVLGECGRSVGERAELEQLWMDLLVVVDDGYNICKQAMTVAGTQQSAEHVARRVQAKVGYKHSPDVRKKLSEKAKARITQGFQGRQHSAETRERLSEVAKQRPPQSDATRRKKSEAMKIIRAERFWSSGSIRGNRQ